VTVIACALNDTKASISSSCPANQPSSVMWDMGLCRSSIRRGRKLRANKASRYLDICGSPPPVNLRTDRSSLPGRQASREETAFQESVANPSARVCVRCLHRLWRTSTTTGAAWLI